MISLEGLQSAEDLLKSQNANEQQMNQDKRRQDVIPAAAEKFKNGDVKGAYMELAAADPEWALKMLGGHGPGGSVDPKIVKSVSIQDPETGQINEHALFSDGSIKPIGVKGFAPQGYFNPTTGEREMSYGGTGDRRGITGNGAGRFINQGSTKPASQPQTAQSKSLSTSSGSAGLVKPQINEEEIKAKKAFQSLDPKMRGFYQTQQEKFMGEVAPDREAAEASKRTIKMLSAGKELNADIMRLFQNQFARASGERGVMTENDVAPFGGKASVFDRLARVAKYQTVGQIPEEDRVFLSELAKKMQQNNEVAVGNKAEAYVNQIAAQTNLTSDQARHLLTKGVTGNGQSSDMVRVINPDGKAGMIPKANLKKALERGFSQAK